jgi:amino acid adenylation domain-containing protein
VELEGLIGCFVNTVVLRTDLSGAPTFRQLLARVRMEALEAYAHQDAPFQNVVEALQPSRPLSHPPLFRVMFALENAPTWTPTLPGLSVHPWELPESTATVDLSLSMRDTPHGLIGALGYSTDLFDADTVAGMLGQFETLLDSVANDPDRPVSRLALLTEPERHQLLVQWNDTRVEFPDDGLVHQLIEAQVERTPDAVAAVFEGAQLSYRELNARANGLAHRLRTLGVGPDTCVGLYLERSLEMVVGILGTLKAGGAYMPLDPAYPCERLASMVELAHAPVLLTQERLKERLPPHRGRVVCLDAAWEVTAGPSAGNPPSTVTGDNLAYVIFTSGSTGQPKGVMNTHQGIRNRLLWMQQAYGLTESDRVLQKTPFGFDVSVWEFLWPLMTGARLVVARPGGHQDRAYLADLIATQGITTVHFVPAMLRVFLDAPGLEVGGPLRRVISSGEALTTDLQERFFARLGAELHNLYGPTEAAVDVTSWACRRGSSGPVVPMAGRSPTSRSTCSTRISSRCPWASLASSTSGAWAWLGAISAGTTSPPSA